MTSLVEGQVEGIVEPMKQVELASEETGTIMELQVDVGDRVVRDQVVLRLDDRLQKLQKKLAEKQNSFTAKLEATQKTLEKRSSILERVRKLTSDGNAGPSELLRAEMEYSIALAKFRATKEERIEKALELERAELKLERRQIRAPHDGIVSLVYKREGEFVSPVQPEVIRLIQIDHVLAVFAIDQSQINSFEVGAEHPIEINGETFSGIVHEIGCASGLEESNHYDQV